MADFCISVVRMDTTGRHIAILLLTEQTPYRELEYAVLPNSTSEA